VENAQLSVAGESRASKLREKAWRGLLAWATWFNILDGNGFVQVNE
jgi:hypothetical protein